MPRNSFRPDVESLEQRCCLSSSGPSKLVPMSPTLTDRTLTVIGTDNADTIIFAVSGGQVSVLGKSFAISVIDRIVVDGEGGDDTIAVSEAFKKETWLYGGWGSDVIRGGGGRDNIFGGDWDDRLFGRSGSDWISGGSGDDKLDGGTNPAGADDRLHGGSGTNTLVNGKSSANTNTQSATALEGRIMELINAERTKRGLAALGISMRLNAAAQRHADQMLASRIPMGQGISHEFTGVASPTLGSRMAWAGYEFSVMRENNFWGSAANTAAEVVAGWMNSPGHRENILATDVRQIGLGIASGDAGFYYCMVVAKA